MDLFSGGALGHLLEVLVVNLILSGDNAVVIAMAVHNLEGKNRRRAVLWDAEDGQARRGSEGGRVIQRRPRVFTRGSRAWPGDSCS